MHLQYALLLLLQDLGWEGGEYVYVPPKCHLTWCVATQQNVKTLVNAVAPCECSVNALHAGSLAISPVCPLHACLITVHTQVTVELKNDLAITGVLHSVDQYLNIKLNHTRVVNEAKYPHMVSQCIACTNETALCMFAAPSHLILQPMTSRITHYTITDVRQELLHPRLRGPLHPGLGCILFECLMCLHAVRVSDRPVLPFVTASSLPGMFFPGTLWC